MNKRGDSKRTQVITDMVDQMYPGLSKSAKEQIAKTFNKQLSNGAVDEVDKRLNDLEQDPAEQPKQKGWWDNDN
jgi:serine protease inhibitor